MRVKRRINYLKYSSRRFIQEREFFRKEKKRITSTNDREREKISEVTVQSEYA